MDVAIVIPARYESVRFPGKPLKKISNKPMIQWVYENAIKVKDVSSVIVATDDQRIFDTVEGFGGKAVMTSASHASGTDRVAEVAELLSEQIIVNVQGDEPLIEPEMIESAIELVRSGRFSMSTLATEFKSPADVLDPNKVKVTFDESAKATEFSRKPIVGSKPLMHVGIYVYQKELLLSLQKQKPVAREKSEKLEQLRPFCNGVAIGVAVVDYQAMGVDTEEDLIRVSKLIESNI